MNYFILILSIAGLLTGCGTPGAQPGGSGTTGAQPGGSGSSSVSAVTKAAEYRKITAKEAYVMMSEQTGYIILDVRTDEEYKDKRIEGAILIPDYEVKNRVEGELADKDQLILVYCRSGRRSENAAREMVSLGYTNVYDFGGINDWPYDTVSG